MYDLYFAGTVYDFYFHKDGQGQWNVWTDSITSEESVIPDGANVSMLSSLLRHYSYLTMSPETWFSPHRYQTCSFQRWRRHVSVFSCIPTSHTKYPCFLWGPLALANLSSTTASWWSCLRSSTRQTVSTSPLALQQIRPKIL